MNKYHQSTLTFDKADLRLFCKAILLFAILCCSISLVGCLLYAYKRKIKSLSIHVRCVLDIYWCSVWLIYTSVVQQGDKIR